MVFLRNFQSENGPLESRYRSVNADVLAVDVSVAMP